MAEREVIIQNHAQTGLLFSNRSLFVLEKQKADGAQLNALKVREYENYIDVIRNMYKECDELIDWKSI